MSCSRELIQLLAVAIVFDQAPLVAQDIATTYVKPEYGSLYELQNLDRGLCGTDQPQLTAVVPVAVVHGDELRTLTPRIRDVAREATRDAALQSKFKAAFHSQPERGAELVLAACGALTPPGTYTVTLDVEKATPAAHPAAQRLSFQLAASRAELRAIRPQTLDRSIGCIGGCSMGNRHALYVLEASGHNALTEIRVRQIEPTTSVEGSTYSGRLEFEGATLLAAGAVGEIQVTLTGDYPLGVSKTAVAVSASELAGPVFVSFEIRNRLHPWLLVPSIFGGLIAGYVLRVVLKNRIERETARSAAQELHRRIATAEEHTTDTSFMNSAQSLKTELEKALASDDGKALEQKVRGLDQKFAVAQRSLELALVGAMEQLERMAHLTIARDGLPRQLATKLAAGSAELTEARALVVDKRDAAATQTRLGHFETNFSNQIASAAREWKAAMRVPLLAVEKLALPSDAQYDARLDLEAVAKRLDEMTVLDRDPAQTIQSVIAANASLRSTLGRIFHRIVDYAGKVAVRLKQKGADSKAVENASQILQDAIVEITGHDADLTRLMEAAARLFGEMKLAVGARTGGSKFALQSLEDGAYRTALEDQGKTADANRTGQSDAAGPVAPIPPPPTATSVIALVGSRHDPVHIEAARTLRQIALAKAAQSLLMSLALALSGMVALLPSFDGSLLALIAAFLWGYASDASADALTAKSRS